MADAVQVGDVRIRYRLSTQWCPECRRLAEAHYVLQFKGNYLVGDTSVCTHCYRVLWDWERKIGAAPAQPIPPLPPIRPESRKWTAKQQRLF